MEWKVFWSALAGAVSLSVGALTALLGVHPMITIVGGVCTGWVVIQVAHRIVHATPMFRDLKPDERDLIVRMIGAATVLHWLWIAVFALRPEWWPWLIIGLVGLCCATTLTAHLHEYLLVKAPKQVVPIPTSADGTKLDDVGRTVHRGLEAAKLGHLKIHGWHPVGDDK